MVVDRKNQKALALPYLVTEAKCCELKRCADRVHRGEHNKYKVREKRFRNLNFSPSTKKTNEYSLYFAIIKFCFLVILELIYFLHTENKLEVFF